MRIQPEIDGVAVVLRGSFNPAIFTPAWFVLHELLPRTAADSATLQVAHAQVTEFSFDWLSLQVTSDMFVAETTQAPHVRVRDLVLRVFEELLYHTPLRLMGINRNTHVPVANLAELDRIGRTLAPVEPWGRYVEELDLGGRDGGMTALKMSQLSPKGRPAGSQINITVEPSNRIGGGRPGVYVQVNDQYAIPKDDPQSGQGLLRALEGSFESSLIRSESIVDHVLSLRRESYG